MSLAPDQAFARPGVTPEDPDAAARGRPDADGTNAPGAAREPDFRGKGRLLEEPKHARVCKQVERLWTQQDARMKPIRAQWDANRLTMDGVPGVRAVKDVDTDTYFARVPFGASAVRLGVSKTAELAHKTTATITVDPPRADVMPSPDDEGDLAKAELSKLVLDNECSESGLNLHRQLRHAASLSETFGTGFLLLEMDPAGGGWTPLAIDAHPAAAAYDPADPEAVLRHPDPEQAAAELELPEAERPQLAKRYVGKRPPPAPDETTPDETTAPGPLPLTDDPEQADLQWQLRPRATHLTGQHLRFLPALARGIDDADGVVIASVATFGTLRGLLPAIDTWPVERQRKLVTWRPVPLKDLLPPGFVAESDGAVYVEGDDPRAGLPADEALCVTLRVLYRSHPAYPDGADILCAGGDAVLHRETRCLWVGAEGEPKRPECLDLPVAPVRRYDDPTGANPYGIGDAELLGPGDELRAQLLADAIETIWRVNHPHLLLPMGSTIQPGRLGDRDDTPILYNAQAGRPEWEVPPGMDPNTLPLFEAVGRMMDSRSGLEDAQRLNAPNITSGKQAQTIQEQALVTISPLNDNYKAAFIRASRILLQQYRAYATQPMLLRYAGEDGRYKVREFVNTDLSSTRDIRIAVGTSTMLSQSAKQSLALQDLEVGLKAGDQEGSYRRYRQAMATNLDPTLGRDRDPHAKRVLRQIHVWRQGPPAGEEMPPPVPLAPPMDPATGQPAVDPATGAPVPLPPPDPMNTPDPRVAALFAPLPVDAQPDVARTRALALGDELARETTEALPRPWVLGLAAVYEAARQAAGIVTIQEQQQQAAAQQQAQQAAQQQQEQGRQESEARKLQVQSSEKQADREATLERERVRAAVQTGSAAA